MKAPVLIFHGTSDNQVPPAQSWSFFRALQYYGKTPVKFVVFPGEPHGPRKLTHQMRKVEEEVAWFDKYFFKNTPPTNEAVKKGSPLEDALKRKNVRRGYGLLYGVPDWRNDFDAPCSAEFAPPPEVVLRGDLQVGRFEVTRAQFHSYLHSACLDKDDKLVPAPGTGNFPANR